MKRCLQCQNEYSSDQTRLDCPACGSEVPLLGSFPSYAPHLAEANECFPPEAFQKLVLFESTNFWFRSRNQLILYLLKKHCPAMQSFLEIGCGTAFVTSAVQKAFPSTAITGSEIYVNGLDEALKRLANNATLIQMDARHIPFTEEFDVIGAFDALEHIEQDVDVLSEIHRALKVGGHVLLSVPQHMKLWSFADEQACHVRRYARDELQIKMQKVGFEVIDSTSFVFFLLPLMYLSRKNSTTEAGLTIPAWQNSVLYAVMQLELLCIKLGFKLPVGGSRFVVGRKLQGKAA